MYRVILVDDEAWVLSGLEELIPWEEMGFSIAACCQSGKEALDAITAYGADAVFTDIRMADMTGLELIEAVSARKIPVEFVIISAYSDFEVARKAITYGAFSYLLKPLDDEEMTEVVQRLHQKLDQKNQAKVHLVSAGGEVPLTETQRSALEHFARFPNCCLFISEAGPPSAEFVLTFYIDGRNGYLLSFPEQKALDPQRLGAGLPSMRWGCSRIAPDFSDFSQMYREALASLETCTCYCAHPVISQVQFYLAEHLAEPLTVKEIAQDFYLSELYLGELFKKCTGDTLISSLKEKRLWYAARQIYRTRRELSEIASGAGFQDYSYFGRCFKRFFGLSPESYRKEHRSL